MPKRGRADGIPGIAAYKDIRSATDRQPAALVA